MLRRLLLIGEGGYWGGNYVQCMSQKNREVGHWLDTINGERLKRTNYEAGTVFAYTVAISVLFVLEKSDSKDSRSHI